MGWVFHFLAIVVFPFGLVIGWRISPYFISSFDKVIHSPFEIWIKKAGFAFACGMGPAGILWIVGTSNVANNHKSSADTSAVSNVNASGRPDSPENVRKAIAEKTIARIAKHPACAEIYKQEETNQGENELICANSEIESAGKSLIATYELVRSGLAADRRTVLENEQSAWINETNNNCDEAANQSLSMSPRFREAAANFCAADAMRKREELIKNFR